MKCTNISILIVDDEEGIRHELENLFRREGFVLARHIHYTGARRDGTFVSMRLPPLRERPSDIPLLTDSSLGRLWHGRSRNMGRRNEARAGLGGDGPFLVVDPPPGVENSSARLLHPSDGADA